MLFYFKVSFYVCWKNFSFGIFGSRKQNKLSNVTYIYQLLSV